MSPDLRILINRDTSPRQRKQRTQVQVLELLFVKLGAVVRLLQLKYLKHELDMWNDILPRREYTQEIELENLLALRLLARLVGLSVESIPLKKEVSLIVGNYIQPQKRLRNNSTPDFRPNKTKKAG